MNADKRRWQQVAQEAANELDPDKLRSLVRELTSALDEQTIRLTPFKPAQPQLKRLLFVDDEEGIRTTLSPILQGEGFEVRTAASVPEALAEIGNREFDVLLSDLNIGEDGDGLTIVHAMRKARPNCVTILLTGYPGFESALQAIHEEVDDYFVKPADVNSLISTIERKLRIRQQ